MLKPIEQRLLVVVQTLNRYNDTNTSIVDPRILSRHLTQPFRIVIEEGNLVSREGGSSYQWKTSVWEIPLTIYGQWHTSIKTNYDQLRDERDTVIQHIERYPTLGGLEGVTYFHPYRADAPRPYESSEAGSLLYATIYCRVTTKEKALPVVMELPND